METGLAKYAAATYTKALQTQLIIKKNPSWLGMNQFIAGPGVPQDKSIAVQAVRPLMINHNSLAQR